MLHEFSEKFALVFIPKSTGSIVICCLHALIAAKEA